MKRAGTNISTFSKHQVYPNFQNVISELWKRYIRRYTLSVPLSFLDHVKYAASLYARWKL